MIYLLTETIKKLLSGLKKPKNILIGLLLILIGVLFFLNLKAKKTIPSLVPTSLPSLTPIEFKTEFFQNSSLKNVQFLGQTPELPSRLPVYEYRFEKIETFCQKTAKNLEFTGEAKKGITGKILKWNQNGKYFKCDLDQNIIYYNQSLKEGGKPELELAKTDVTTFLQKANINTDQFQLAESETKYFKAENLEYIGSSQEEAEIIVLKYQLNLNSIPLFHEQITFYPLEVHISYNSQISKLEYYPLPVEFFKKDDYPIMPVEEAVAKLNQGQGKIIDLIKTNQGEVSDYSLLIPLDTSGITSASLFELKLVYFFSIDNDLIVPVFIFSGSGLNSKGENINLSVIIPAIK